MTFEALEPIPLNLPRPTFIRPFKHSKSDFRVIFVQQPGPLVSTSIIVPTVTHDNAGLPHTLEHLIFCGSKEFPERGYLDVLSTRCLSSGTNAYTCEDHTAYTIVTAGQEGMSNVIPVFLDHILNPTLTQEQFLTEVCHMDDQGKYQGVVYCEMAARENSEGDLMNFALSQIGFHAKFRKSRDDSLNRLLETYTFECGGRTIDIRTLTNADIVEYHKIFYHLDLLTVLVVGNVEPSLVLDNISKQKFFTEYDASKAAVRRPLPSIPVLSVDLSAREPHMAHEIHWDSVANRQVATKIVEFPSSDDSNGSLGFIWNGPSSSDFKTVVAIDILFRCLSESSASVIHQQFVEGDVMYASDSEFEFKMYLSTRFVFALNSVPLKPSKDDQEDGSDGSGSEVSVSSSGETKENSWFSAKQIDFSSRESILNAYIDMFFKLMAKVQERGIPLEEIKASIKKYRIRILESLEDDPLSMISSYITTDIIFDSYKRFSKAFPECPKMGARFEITHILADLETESWDFWLAILTEWVVMADVGAVLMVPSPELAKSLAENSDAEIASRVAKMGATALEQQGQLIERAVNRNKVNLSETALTSMAGIPNTSGLPDSEYRMEIVDVATGDLPFSQVQLVQADTNFVYIKMGLPTFNIPAELKPYMVLFQELMFQCPVALSESEREPALLRANSVGFNSQSVDSSTLDYRAVVKLLSSDLVHYESGVGIGNDTFSCNWLGEMFILTGQISLEKIQVPSGNAFPISQSFQGAKTSIQRESFALLTSWLCKIFSQSVFTQSRILNVVSTLLSSLVEIKRDGSECASHLLVRVSEAVHRSANWKDLKPDDGPIANDVYLSIFSQEKFLEQVKKQIQDDPLPVIEALNKLRKAILTGVAAKASECPGFVHIGLPSDISREETKQFTQDFIEIWRSFAPSPKTVFSPKSLKRLKDGTPVPLQSPFFARKWLPYSLHSTFKKDPALLLPMKGITSCYLVQLVPCDFFVSAEKVHEDFLPLMVLVSIISITEGPLFTGIRGRGYAYGSGLSLYMWNGQLAFEVSDAREPVKALECFWDIIETWLNAKNTFPAADGKGVSIVTKFQIDAAISSIIYRICASTSTVGGIFGEMLKASIRGFGTLKEYQMREKLSHLTGSDLDRVLHRYLARFLEDSRRITVMTTPISPPAEYQSATSTSGKTRLRFEVVSFEDLELVFNK